MTVFCVIESYSDWDANEDRLRGVFSTFDKAKEAENKERARLKNSNLTRQQRERYSYEINAITLDELIPE